MARLFFFLMVCFCPYICYGQQVSIENIRDLSSDLTARTYPRKDLNGNRCAVIKIIGNAEVLSVSGNIIGDLVNKGNEYWAYLTPNTKMVVLNIKGAKPVKINFEGSGVTLLSGNTYELSFEYIDDTKTVLTSGITLLFNSDVTVLNPKQKEMLLTLIKTVRDNMPNASVSVMSFICRDIGTYGYAMELSNRRAKETGAFLEKNGLRRDQIVEITGGESAYSNYSDKGVVIVEIRK